MRFFILIGIYACLNAIGQLLIKIGTHENRRSHKWQRIIQRQAVEWYRFIWPEFSHMDFILFKVNLSYAFSFAVGLGYMAVLVLAILTLKESTTTN